jgi:hypothetical protein
MKQYRLLERALVGGEVHEAGYEFTLPDGVPGPMKTITLKHERYQAVGGEHVPGEYKDVPLYEEV